MDDRTTPRPRGLAQIILALSPADGLVAVPVGEQYGWADTALRLTPGFERRPDCTYALHDVDTAKPNLLALAENARRHRVLLFGGPRPYLGDYATALADGLPGTWTVKVEIYAHPVWQEDLVPLLWDAGELIDAVEHSRIPYAANLTNSAGIELLLVERPGSAHEYLLGCFASTPFDDNYADPHAPSSIVLPSDAAHAMRPGHRHVPALVRTGRPRTAAGHRRSSARQARGAPCGVDGNQTVRPLQRRHPPGPGHARTHRAAVPRRDLRGVAPRAPPRR